MLIVLPLPSSLPAVNAGPGDVPPNGSQQPAWTATQDQDPNTGVKNNDYYQTITAMPEYRGASLEVRRHLLRTGGSSSCAGAY